MQKREAVEKAPVEQEASRNAMPIKPGVRRKTILDVRSILTVLNKDPNYHYRFVPDRTERPLIPGLLDRGYEFVARIDESVVGDDRVNAGHAVDGRYTVRSGGELLVLMRIKREWYEEDRRLFSKSRAELESAITKKGKGEEELIDKQVSISIKEGED